jgi:hypothetical protein
MTNVTAPSSCYLPSNSLNLQVKEYPKGTVMDYINNKCPIFAQCVTRAHLEDWFAASSFQSTCFVPCEEYNKRYYAHFRDNPPSIDNARHSALSSTIRNLVSWADLTRSEVIPTYGDFVMQCASVGNSVRVSGYTVLATLEFTNGIVHIINGLVV